MYRVPWLFLNICVFYTDILVLFKLRNTEELFLTFNGHSRYALLMATFPTIGNISPLPCRTRHYRAPLLSTVFGVDCLNYCKAKLYLWLKQRGSKTF